MTGLDLAGAVVVVTGAGSGIGAAMARAFAAAGSRVLVSDVRGPAAAAVADDIGGIWAQTDCADAVAVQQLVDRAIAEFGAIDMFCANAGVAPEGGPDAPDAVWQQAFEVNVMSHVFAARALLPGWLARGRGRLITTVSAAGLLTMLGSAPYSVTKHAALAFAEWLRATYSHRGIVVQSLCPQGVRTPLLDGTGDVGRAMLGSASISAVECAQVVVRALAGDKFLILPHPEVADYAARRAGDPDRWLAGMNRLQRSLEVDHPDPRPAPPLCCRADQLRRRV